MTTKELYLWQTGQKLMATKERIKTVDNSSKIESKSKSLDVVILNKKGEVEGIAMKEEYSINLSPKVVFNAQG